MKLDLAHRTRPRPGETHNGDAVWVGAKQGRLAFAVFDATGHGHEAHEASEAACGVLERWDGGVDPAALANLAKRLHEDLRGTRGAACVFSAFDGTTLTGFGIGNVEMRAIDRSISTLLTPGVLGVRLRRRVHVFEISLQVGDRLLAYSDGIEGRADREYRGDLSPADLCDSLIRDHSRPHDDATVLVADVLDDA